MGIELSFQHKALPFVKVKHTRGDWIKDFRTLHLFLKQGSHVFHNGKSTLNYVSKAFLWQGNSAPSVSAPLAPKHFTIV